MAGQHNSGVWLNKRAVSVIEMSLAHTFRPTPEGWEIEASAAGTLVVRLVHGGEQRFELQPGDTLRASGEEMYLILTPRAPRPV